MKGASSVSRPVWALLIAGVLLAAAGWTAPRVRPVPSALDAELTALRTERVQMRELGDDSLHTLRQQVAAHPQPAWTTAQLDALTSALSSDWRSEWQTNPGATRRLTIVRKAPRLADWSAYLEALRAWTTRPGVVLDSLEIVANGGGGARQFQRVALTLRFAVTSAAINNGERSASGPLPVVPAAEAATTRNIGPVQPQLRANAAPFRPDLPGAPGGDDSPATQKPNEEKP